MAQFKPVLNGPVTEYFIQFVPYAPKEVINSPIVESVSFYGCTEAEDKMRAMVETAKEMEGCNGVSSGYSINEVNGSKVFVAAIGWVGIDASKAADKAAYTGSLKAEVHHINFNFPIKGFRGL